MLGNDTGMASFFLEVGAGPAPGWRQPAVHGDLQLFLSSAGMTAVGARLLAVSDLNFREIVVFDPFKQVVVSSLA